MTRNTQFFGALREWSFWKHRILEQYLAAFAMKVGHFSTREFYVDAYAGEGEYREDGSPGSPIIAARIAEKILRDRHKHTLHCINVEAKRKHFQRLETLTKDFDRSIITNLFGTFETQLHAVLQMTQASPAFFFLDPFGPTHLPWSVIADLSRRSGPTEFVINFNTPGYLRIARLLHANQRYAQIGKRLIERIFGYEAWRDMPDDDTSSTALSLYLDQIRHASNWHVHAIEMRTVTEQLKYHLIYATRHPEGVRTMSDIVQKVARERYAQQLQLGIQSSMDALLLPPESEVRSRLLQDIRRTFPRGSRTRFDNLHRALSNTYFGVATETQFRQAVRELMNANVIKPAPAIRDNTLLEFVQ